jgi:hypothetical protein
MAALLPFPLAPESGLIVQYEAQTPQTHGCGGAYMKLLSPPDGWAPQRLRSRTPYSIMFGPDRCGAAARVREGAGGPSIGAAEAPRGRGRRVCHWADGPGPAAVGGRPEQAGGQNSAAQGLGTQPTTCP